MEKIEMMRHQGAGGALPKQFCRENYEKVKAYHESMDGFAVTPLVDAAEIAEKAGVAKLYVKDESKRYGLNAFKALGAAYAIGNIVRKGGLPEDAVFVTATDGNHGRAVAWAAAKEGYRSVVFMPAGTVRARSDAIAGIEGATVYVTDLNYDDAVRKALKYADENHGIFVQDTGFEGYEDIPWDITLGYTKLAQEALEQMGDEIPTHVFLQAGVGSMAGGVLGYLKDVLGDRCPVVSIMEATESACIFESVKNDGYVAIGGSPQTIMAGLNCGEANIFTLEVIRDHASFYFKVPDYVTVDGMNALHDIGVTAGECGGIGTGLLLDMTDDMKKEMGIGEDSVVLVISTEGDTDPEFYKSHIK